MDPNGTLDLIRAYLDESTRELNSENANWLLGRAAEQMKKLDEHLSNGGELPREWKADKMAKYIVRIVANSGWIYRYEIEKELADGKAENAILMARLKHSQRIQLGDLHETERATPGRWSVELTK